MGTDGGRYGYQIFGKKHNLVQELIDYNKYLCEGFYGKNQNKTKKKSLCIMYGVNYDIGDTDW